MFGVIRAQARKYLSIANASRPSSATPVSACAVRLPARAKVFIAKRYMAITSKMTTLVLLNGKGDGFNGVLVDSSKERVPADLSFQELLHNSIEEWTQTNRRGIWFKVHLGQSEWVPVLVQNGFTYHHAKRDYVMLLRWLPTHESCNVPPFAHTMVGVGAVVINSSNEVLVVFEKYLNKGNWKLPGGYVEPGENFVDAAIREVYEETNIPTEFRSVLAFRHGHGGQFQCSDLYTVVSLKPLSTEIRKCDREIQACKWMKVDEYMSHPDIHELNRLFVHKYFENEKQNMKIECSHGIHQRLRKPYTVYHAVPTSGTNNVVALSAEHVHTNKL